MSSRLILRSAAHKASMLAQSFLAQSESNARTGCSSCWKVAIRSLSYPKRPARLYQSLSGMWLQFLPSPPRKRSVSSFSLAMRGRSKQGSSSMETTMCSKNERKQNGKQHVDIPTPEDNEDRCLHKKRMKNTLLDQVMKSAAVSGQTMGEAVIKTLMTHIMNIATHSC